MSLIMDLQRELQEASAAVARAERVAAQYPNRPSVLATLETIQSRRHNLEEQFANAAKDAGLETCSYRIEYEDHKRATIARLTAALGAFQRVFTSVYDSILNGPKKRARISEEVEDQTAFGFGYTFQGSVGFMLTLPAERLLLEESKFDEAMGKTLKLLSLKDAESVQDMTNSIGLAAVRLAHQWALENAKAGFGAEIRWKRERTGDMGLRIQPEEVAALASVISSATSKEQVRLTGELLNVNYSERTFEMKCGEETITGSFAQAISEENPARVPKRYLASLTINTRIALIDGQEKIDYFLNSLEEPASGGGTFLLSS